MVIKALLVHRFLSLRRCRFCLMLPATSTLQFSLQAQALHSSLCVSILGFLSCVISHQGGCSLRLAHGFLECWGGLRWPSVALGLRALQVDLSTDAKVREFWQTLPEHPLVNKKAGRMNLGKFQSPTVVMSKTISSFALKAYIYNVCALSLGFRGTNRGLPPAQAAAAAAGSSEVAVAGKATLKQTAHVCWSDNCSNQWDRAAWLYGDMCHFNSQKTICNVLKPIALYHGRRFLCFSSLFVGR